MKKIINILCNSAIILLFSFCNLLVLTSILFLLKIPITIFNLPLSFCFSIIEIKLLKKPNHKETILSILLSILVLIVSILISNRVMDISYDGNSYHKAAIGTLKNGWNPIYSSTNHIKNKIKQTSSIWIDHYPKSTWIYGASIYKITNNIESSKSYNFIIIYISVCLLIYSIQKYKEKNKLLYLAILTFIFFPIMLEQMFTLYVDAFLGINLFLIVLHMHLFIKNDKDKEIFSILSALLVITMNIKYTGLAYSGIFCLGYFIPYIINKLKVKDYKTLKINIIKFSAVVITGLLIVGSNSYVKNLFDHKNPFYPLVGKDKVDIMTDLQPASFKNKSAIEKNIISIFSRTEDAAVYNGKEPVLKRPFTYSYYEMSQFSPDIRIGGYGVLFSGILIICAAVIFSFLIYYVISRKFDELIFISIPIFITILCMFFIGDTWWARYFPQLYLFIIFAIYILLNNEKKILKLFGIILVLLVILNGGFILSYCKNFVIPKSGYTRIALEKIENKKVNFYLGTTNFYPVIYNLDDYNIKYNIVDEKNSNFKRLYIGNTMFEVTK